MIEKLSGSKTYIFMLAFAVLKIARGTGVLHSVDPAVLDSIEGVLLAGAGIALRAGVQKSENAKAGL